MARDHADLSVKFPVLVTMRAKPVAARVMMFVAKPNSHAIIFAHQDVVDQLVSAFPRPFTDQEVAHPIINPLRLKWLHDP